MRSLAKEISDWANRRPNWQRGVIARLAAGEELAHSDYDEVARRLADGERAWDISDVPADWSRIGAADGPAQLIELTIRSGVNALAEGETLRFGLNGLTVVYGDNGSGKSGYARLLKRAVGARVQEEVLPNIFQDQDDAQPAAEIVYAIGGVRSAPCEWRSAPEELQRIRFFDASCSHAYLTSESDVTYRPAELFVLDGLVEACDGVGRQLDLFWHENNERAAALPAVSPDGEAARFIANLSPQTENPAIDDACRVEPNTGVRIQLLRQEDGRIRSSNPGQERARLKALAGRCRQIANHLHLCVEALGPDAALAVAEQRRVATELRASATIAAQQSFQNEPVAGAGSDTWRVLWEAARSFSEQEAFAGEPFPVVGADAKCVLCHQDLDPAARSRMERFEAWVRDETEQRAADAEREAAAATTRIGRFRIVPSEVLAAVEVLGIDEQELARDCQKALDELGTLVEDITEGRGTDAAALNSADDAARALRGKARGFEASASLVSSEQFEKNVAAIREELTELEDRLLLAAAQDVIHGEVARLRERERIEHARRQTNTSAITRKSSELTRDFVTARMQEQFAAETHRLRLKRLVLKDAGGQKGRLKNQPAFEGAVQNPPIERVLSEGEQRALGLAGFFTEAALDASGSALVLDDPASSFDHVHRALAAERLAEFAADRQVIVFTHDIAFVAELHQAATQAETPFIERSVELRGDGTPGICRDSHPWKAKSVTTRFDELERDLARFRKTLEGSSQEERIRETADWAGKLSETWERIIRAAITSPLFDPGTQHVAPKRFRLLVSISPEDNRVFQESYSRISRWVRRHDKSLEVNSVPPRIEELEDELRLVRQWFDRVKRYD